MGNRRGMTLVELIIVLAVISIIGAILIPNFITTTDKARLKSDVQSARILQNALELYNAEQSARMPHSDIADVIDELDDKGYIDGALAVLQTEDAQWRFDAATGTVSVDITGCGGPASTIRAKVYGQLSDLEKEHVYNGS